MRIYLKNKCCIKAFRLKKFIAALVLSFLFAFILSGFVFNVYKPYISALAVNKVNIFMQKCINSTVSDTLNVGGYSDFLIINKDADNKITGIEADTVSINRLKADFLNRLALRLDDVEEQKLYLPFWAFLNNPFLSEIGPEMVVRIKPLAVVSEDITGAFDSAGINQTKYQLDFKFKVKVLILMPLMKIEHVVATSVPIAQTIIVGDVPGSYTNVSTSHDKLDDTVLQLAGN